MCKLSYLNVDLYSAWAVHVAANGCEENSISEALELPGVVVHTIDEYGTEIVHINHASAACSVDSYNLWCSWHIYILDNYDVQADCSNRQE